MAFSTILNSQNPGQILSFSVTAASSLHHSQMQSCPLQSHSKSCCGDTKFASVCPQKLTPEHQLQQSPLSFLFHPLSPLPIIPGPRDHLLRAQPEIQFSTTTLSDRYPDALHIWADPSAFSLLQEAGSFQSFCWLASWHWSFLLPYPSVPTHSCQSCI